MEITFTLNGKKVTPQIDADTLLIDLVRSWLLQCETWMRDIKLRIMYGIYG